MPTVCDVFRQIVTMMNIPPSSTGQIHLLRLQIQLLGCCGSAVQGLHIYGSVVDGAGCGGSERTKRVHRGSGRMAVRDPWPLGRGCWGHSCNWGGFTFSFASTLSAGWATAVWYLHTTTHYSVNSRLRFSSYLRNVAGSLPMLSFSLQETE